MYIGRTKDRPITRVSSRVRAYKTFPVAGLRHSPTLKSPGLKLGQVNIFWPWLHHVMLLSILVSLRVDTQYSDNFLFSMWSNSPAVLFYIIHPSFFSLGPSPPSHFHEAQTMLSLHQI